MPLSPPAPRKPSHTRRVIYQGYEREDGLWDIEAELHDSKPFDGKSLRDGSVRPAGAPIHHMWLRVTVGRDLVVHAIEAAMDTVPLHDCPLARTALQQMVGCSMARGWRQSIQKHMGGVASCTHLRELLFNLATAAFQTIPHHLEMQRLQRGESWHSTDTPPFFMGKCMTWDYNGPVVARYAPQFVGWIKPQEAGKTS